MKYLLFQFPIERKVYCAFQMRSPSTHGEADGQAGNISFQTGDSEENVEEARRDLFGDLRRLGMEAWSECRQVHGKEIIINPGSTPLDARPQALPGADGMISSTPGLGLMIKTADCQPVFLTDAGGTNVMALHVGWRGNRLDFPGEAVKLFCDICQLRPQDLLAVRGPSLGPAAAEFVNFDKEWGEAWKRWFNAETRRMDLWALTRHQLCHGGGLKNEAVFGVDICTSLNSGEFFSYRKDRRAGRQANFIWIA